jgi:hypothetical protein
MLDDAQGLLVVKMLAEVRGESSRSYPGKSKRAFY